MGCSHHLLAKHPSSQVQNMAAYACVRGLSPYCVAPCIRVRTRPRPRPRTHRPLFFPTPHRARPLFRSKNPVLRRIRYLEPLPQTLARLRRLPARRLNPINGIDAALAFAIINEMQPLDSAFVPGAAARAFRRLGFGVLAHEGEGEGRAGDFVERKGWCCFGEEVVAEKALVALRVQVDVEEERRFVEA